MLLFARVRMRVSTLTLCTQISHLVGDGRVGLELEVDVLPDM